MSIPEQQWFLMPTVWTRCWALICSEFWSEKWKDLIDWQRSAVTCTGFDPAASKALISDWWEWFVGVYVSACMCAGIVLIPHIWSHLQVSYKLSLLSAASLLQTVDSGLIWIWLKNLLTSFWWPIRRKKFRVHQVDQMRRGVKIKKWVYNSVWIRLVT